MSMNGSQQAADTLRAALAEPMRAVAAAVNQARHAQADMNGVDDLVALMGSVAGVVLAMEALQDAAKRAEAAGRAALAATMADTGATTVQTAGHTVSLRKGSRRVTVTNPELIPPEYMRQPPPTPDLAAIAAALRERKPVPGAVLSNGGAETIQIRNRERADA